MKKGILSALIAMALVFSSHFSWAQTNGYPAINLSGQIFDEYGNVVGWISKEGVVQNAIDDRIAIIDPEGNAMDGHGQRIGRMNMKGAFYDPHGKLLFTLSSPKDEQCEMLDPKGKVIGLVHAHFKKQASAILCMHSRMKSY